MKIFLFSLALSLSISGCASFSGVENAQNIAKLKLGMTQSQVLSTLGTPDSIIKPSTDETQWIYEFKSEDKHGQNMFVEFAEGKLTKTGKLSGREIAAANETRTSGVCTHRIHKEMQQEALCLK